MSKKEPEKKAVIDFAKSLDKKKTSQQPQKVVKYSALDIMKRLKGSKHFSVGRIAAESEEKPTRGAKKGARGRGAKVVTGGRERRTDDIDDGFGSEDGNQEFEEAAAQELGVYESEPDAGEKMEV